MLNIPARIIQGVTVSATGSLDDYKATAYDLRVVFVRDGEQTVVDATADGDGYVITIPKAVTQTMAVGDHYWQAFVTNTGNTERHQVGEGVLEVQADFEQQTGGLDARSALRKQVDAIQAVIAGVATDDQKKMKYADREIERFDRAELVNIYRFLRRELDREERAIKAANGQTFGGVVRVRF